MENGRLKFIFKYSHCTAVQLPVGNLIKNTIRKYMYMSLEHYCIPEIQIKHTNRLYKYMIIQNFQYSRNVIFGSWTSLI